MAQDFSWRQTWMQSLAAAPGCMTCYHCSALQLYHLCDWPPTNLGLGTSPPWTREEFISFAYPPHSSQHTLHGVPPFQWGCIVTSHSFRYPPSPFQQLPLGQSALSIIGKLILSRGADQELKYAKHIHMSSKITCSVPIIHLFSLLYLHCPH